MSNESMNTESFDEVVSSNSSKNGSVNNSASTYIDMEKVGWLANNLHRLMVSISVVWFAIVVIYITQFFGWSNLFLMMPDEFGGFLAGVTLPLAIIWVVMAYIDRGTSFKNEAKFLRAYMNQLVYPEEGSAKTAKAMADAIRSQIVELQEVTKVATKQTDIIKNELGGRVDDFARLVSILDNYSGKSMVELGETIETLTKSFEYVTSQANHSTDNFKDCISDFSVAANTLQRDLGSLVSIVGPQIRDLEGNSAKLEILASDNEVRMGKANDILLEFSAKSSTNMEYVTDLLGNQINKIDKLSNRVAEEYRSIDNVLDGSLSRVDDVLRSQSKFVLEHVDLLDKRSDIFAKKLGEHGDVINLEMEKVLARTSGIEESIAIQVRDLNNVSRDIEVSMRDVGDSINEQIVNLDDKSKYAVSSLNTVVDKLEDEIVRISNISEDSISRANAISSDIEEKQNRLQDISGEMVVKLKGLSQEIDVATSNAKTQSDESVESFYNVSQVMKKNTDSLSEATSVIVSQSKIGETSLAQQQRHIADSISKLEATKGELKRQIDELTRAAVIINQEAESSLVNLKQQLVDAVDCSDEVNKRSKFILGELKEQAVEFDDTTNKVLEKANKVEEIITSQNKKLENISQVVSTRAGEVSVILDKHTQLVDEATNNSTKTYTSILNSFETQSVLLNSVSENTVSYVSEVVQALDEKAEAINLLFKHQENEFKDICDRISENTGNISGSLKQHLSTIEKSTDRVFSRMSILEDDVNKRSEVVIQSSNRTIEKLVDVDTSIGLRNKEIDDLVNKSTDKLVGLADSFKASIGAFGDIVKEVKEETSQTTNILVNNFNKVKEVNHSLVQETKNVSSIIDSNIKNIDLAMIKTKAQSESIKETFEQQKENLSDIVNVVATQTRLGEASLAQQYKTLSDVSTDVAKKINDINSKFKEGTDKVFDTSGKLAYEIDVLGDRLIKVGEDIAKTSKSSIKDVEQVNMSLTNCAENLTITAKDSTSKVGDLMKGYEGYISRFNNVTAEASTGVVEISELISEQSDKMIKISEDTKELVECFNVVLNDTSLQLSNRANYAYDKVKGLGESFKNLSMQLEETTKVSSKHMENSGEKLRSSISEIATNAERVSNEIRNSGEVFLKQSEVLVAATDDTLKKVGDVMGYLSKTTTDFSKKTDNIVQKSATFNEMFGKQVDILSLTSKKADAKLKELEKGYDNVQLDSFFKSAASIVEQLEAMAVDINRIYNPDSEEELWKKYYNGDSSAFVRHLSKTLTKKQIINIKNLFEKNGEFRSFVTRYLAEFEHVLEKAKINEKSSLLLSVLSGSDIGKIYYVLAKALDKIE